MKSTKTLPVLIISLAALATGATLVSAQDGQSADAATTATATDARADDGESVHAGYRNHHRGDHGDKRRGGRHDGRFGGRQVGHDMMQQVLREVDANDDGSITQKEIDTFRADKVASADTDGNSALDVDEFDSLYREYTRSRMVDLFQDFDADGNGAISQPELDERFGSVVERMDRNDDGALSRDDRGGRHRS